MHGAVDGAYGNELVGRRFHTDTEPGRGPTYPAAAPRTRIRIKDSIE